MSNTSIVTPEYENDIDQLSLSNSIEDTTIHEDDDSIDFPLKIKHDNNSTILQPSSTWVNTNLNLTIPDIGTQHLASDVAHRCQTSSRSMTNLDLVSVSGKEHDKLETIT
jgi:hypothetical protein